MYECPSIEVLESMGFDFNTTFGVEFEFYCMDADRQGVADFLNNKTGIAVAAEHYNHVDNDHYWKIVTDASLDGDEDEGEYDCEDCNVSRECDHDCAHHCEPSYECSTCSVQTWDGPDKDRPECDDCAELNDFPEYNCNNCEQEEYCDEDCSYHCHASYSGKQGMELVSPVLGGYNGVEQMHQILGALEDLDCSVDHYCGMHIHLDGGTLVHRAVKNLAALYAKYEVTIDSILPASRRNNCNCKSMCADRLFYRNPLPPRTRLERLAQRCEDIDSTTILHELQRIWGDRFLKLNLEAMSDHETVEFRQHGGTLDFDKALNWIILCMNMKQRAEKIHNKVVLGAESYPSLDSMMDELQASPAIRGFWEARREYFAADVDKERSRLDEEEWGDQKRRAQREHDERVGAQESLRWNAETLENPEPVTSTDRVYPDELFASTVSNLIGVDFAGGGSGGCSGDAFAYSINVA